MIGRFASLTPRAQVQLTQYDLTNAESNGFPSTPNMAVPIFDVNGSLYFDRKVNFLSQNLIQTLEPKIYYLFVPFQHQDNPTFDTYLQSFNYDYMFLDNRFSGIDRIGDTNQVTLALATKFLEENSGFERASASIGQIRYFKNRRVQLTNNNEVNTSDASSIAAKATYNLTPHWSAVGEASLNSESNKFDSNSFTIRYQPEKKRFINVSYNFVRLGDKLVTPTGDNNDSKVDLKQTDVYAYWRLTEQYNLLARWNYNWGQQRAQAFLYGIEYQSCCWAVRVGGERRFMGINPNNDFIFDNMFFIQFELKGLGVVGQGPSTKGASTLEDSIKNLFV
jgi:LPS-assembly protein